MAPPYAHCATFFTSFAVWTSELKHDSTSVSCFFVPKMPGNTEQQHVVRTVLSMIDVAIFQIIIQREGRKKKAEKK